MYDISCKLLSTTFTGTDARGKEVFETIKEEIPILKVENVWIKEFYAAGEKGQKPNLRLKISSLNYNEQEELEYMGKIYSIIRTDISKTDEIILVCERKVRQCQILTEYQ